MQRFTRDGIGDADRRSVLKLLGAGGAIAAGGLGALSVTGTATAAAVNIESANPDTLASDSGEVDEVFVAPSLTVSWDGFDDVVGKVRVLIEATTGDADLNPNEIANLEYTPVFRATGFANDTENDVETETGPGTSGEFELDWFAGDEHVVLYDEDGGPNYADGTYNCGATMETYLNGTLMGDPIDSATNGFYGPAGDTSTFENPVDGGGSIETSGVWFLDPSDGPSASLSLPSLPSGWTYEGWIVHEGTPISTGTFDDPASADDAAPHSGTTNPAPPFPGEDLIHDAPDGLSFPTDLTDGESQVVISVEPDLDGTDPTGPAPFAIKPLSGSIPGDGGPGTSYALDNTDPTLPSGSASLSGSSNGTITYAFSDLPELAQGHYEGWAIFDDEKVSTGTFSVGDDYTFDVGQDLSGANRIVVTIEPDEDDDPAPSGIPIVAGDLSDGSADLGFPVSFDDAAGSYILATPTDGDGGSASTTVYLRYTISLHAPDISFVEEYDYDLDPEDVRPNSPVVMADGDGGQYPDLTNPDWGTTVTAEEAANYEDLAEGDVVPATAIPYAAMQENTDHPAIMTEYTNFTVDVENEPADAGVTGQSNPGVAVEEDVGTTTPGDDGDDGESG